MDTNAFDQWTVRTRRFLLLPLAVVIAAFFALPLFWMTISAVRPHSEIFAHLSPLHIGFYVPDRPTAHNVTAVLSGDFLRSMINSLVTAVGTVVIGIAVSVPAAFALSAFRFRGRQVLFIVIVTSFLVPFEAIALPLADNVRQAGMENTYWALILPAIGNGQAIFLLRQFFLAVPVELREAARVDGASWWTILWRIYVPLSWPAVISAGLILFHFQWQAYLWPLLVSTSPDMELAPVTLARFLGQFDFDYGQLFAGSLIATIIPALVMLRFQRYFTTSLATSGVKG